MFKSITRQVAVGSALVGGAVAPVLAAVPAEASTALEAMKTDGLAVATIVLVALIAVAAFKFMRKGL